MVRQLHNYNMFVNTHTPSPPPPRDDCARARKAAHLQQSSTLVASRWPSSPAEW